VNLLYPRIRLKHLPAILGHAAVGAVIAAMFGVVHDQITFSLSPEYFTRLKFLQFHYANFGLPQRIFVAEIGVLATWWVGLIAGWFIARKTVPNFPPKVALLKSLKGFAVMFLIAVFGSIMGYTFGLIRGPNADYSNWMHFASRYGVENLPDFVRVAYIHNASYLGGLVGLVAALVVLRKDCKQLKDRGGRTSLGSGPAPPA
jgi:hypothetical protein